MRGLGGIAVAQGLPDALVVLFAAVTTLADTWFVFGLVTLAYWFLPERFCPYPRRAMATLVAVATCTLAAVTLLKHGFALPRPGGAATPTWLPDVLAAWYDATVDTNGFGFPSGHASGAAALYGGLAVLLNRPNRGRRLAALGAVAVAVALSRVVIRVHYLVDVIAGLLLGSAVLYVGLRLAGAERPFREAATTPLRPTPVFLLAAGVAVAGIAVSTATGHPEGVFESAVGLGTALGGAGGWRLLDGDEGAVPARIAAPGLVVAAGCWLGTLAIGPAPPVAAALAALGTGIVLALPAIGTRLTGR